MDRAARALHALEAHHSKPLYKVPLQVVQRYVDLYGYHPMTWHQPKWGNNSQNRSKRKSTTPQDKDKSEKNVEKFPAYDRGLSDNGGAAPSSSASLPPSVVTLLQSVAEKDSKAAEALESLLPDATSEELRSRQRQLNAVRKAKQKLDRKESSLAKKEAMMVRFLEETRQHVLSEKARHKVEVETLKQEILEAKEALERAKNGQQEEDDHMGKAEDDLDSLLGQDHDLQLQKENQDLKEQIQRMTLAQRAHQTQMYDMQARMEELRRSQERGSEAGGCDRHGAGQWSSSGSRSYGHCPFYAKQDASSNPPIPWRRPQFESTLTIWVRCTKRGRAKTPKNVMMEGSEDGLCLRDPLCNEAILEMNGIPSRHVHISRITWTPTWSGSTTLWGCSSGEARWLQERHLEYDELVHSFDDLSPDLAVGGQKAQQHEEAQGLGGVLLPTATPCASCRLHTILRWMAHDWFDDEALHWPWDFLRWLLGLLVGGLGCLICGALVGQSCTGDSRGVCFKFLWMAVLIIRAAGSFDEAVAQHLHIAHRAAEDARLQEYMDRWAWVEQNIGLVRPILHPTRDVMIHRTTMPRGYYPTKHVFIIHNGDDAITTVQDIERIWRDLGPYDDDPFTWTICETDSSIRDSPLPQQYEHWILASTAEARRNTIATTVMVEVQWNTRSSVETIVTAVWLYQRGSRFLILQQLGLLRACGTTHQCEMLCNGRLCSTAAVYLECGHYVKVIGKPHDNPGTGLAIRPTAIPKPCSSPSTNCSFAERPESEQSQFFEDDICLQVEEHTCHIIIYRVTAGRFIPQTCHVVEHRTDELPREEISLTWPDLDHITWKLYGVDETYYDDFPQVGCVIVRLIHDRPHELAPGKVYVTLLVITWQGSPLTKAIYLPIKVTVSYLLNYLHLTEMCEEDSTTCRIYYNGQPLDQTQFVRSKHGQYVRIDIDSGDRLRIQQYLDTAFDVTTAAAGYEQIDFPMLDYYLHVQSQNVDDVTSYHHLSEHQWLLGPDDPGAMTIRTPKHRVCHAQYWITMAWLMIPAAFLLARLQYQPRYRGKLKRQYHRKSVRSRTGIARTLFFCTLLLSAEALPIWKHHGSLGPGSIPFHEWHGKTDAFKHFHLSSTQGLAPPGNPPDTYDAPVPALVITPFGRRQLHDVCKILTAETAIPISLADALPPRRPLHLAEVLSERPAYRPDGKDDFVQDTTNVSLAAPDIGSHASDVPIVPSHTSDIQSPSEISVTLHGFTCLHRIHARHANLSYRCLLMPMLLTNSWNHGTPRHLIPLWTTKLRRMFKRLYDYFLLQLIPTRLSTSTPMGLTTDIRHLT